MKKSWEIRQNVALKAAFTSRCKISSNMIVDLNFRTKNKFLCLALLEKSPKWDLTFLSERNELMPEAT